MNVILIFCIFISPFVITAAAVIIFVSVPGYKKKVPGERGYFFE